MKKLVTLLLAAGLVFGAAHPSKGVEVKAGGIFDFAFAYTGGLGGNNVGSYSFMDTKDMQAIGVNLEQKHQTAVQRLLLSLQFIMAENLSAYWDGMFGYFTWGGPATGIYYPQNQNGGELGLRRPGHAANRVAAARLRSGVRGLRPGVFLAAVCRAVRS